jgi:hypothetical protein
MSRIVLELKLYIRNTSLLEYEIGFLYVTRILGILKFWFIKPDNKKCVPLPLP